MRGLGKAAGLEDCPNPQCAIFLQSNDSDLDMKGRNFCPPCFDRVRAAALAKGAKLQEAP